MRNTVFNEAVSNKLACSCKLWFKTCMRCAQCRCIMYLGCQTLAAMQVVESFHLAFASPSLLNQTFDYATRQIVVNLDCALLRPQQLQSTYTCVKVSPLATALAPSHQHGFPHPSETVPDSYTTTSHA